MAFAGNCAYLLWLIKLSRVKRTAHLMDSRALQRLAPDDSKAWDSNCRLPLFRERGEAEAGIEPSCCMFAPMHTACWCCRHANSSSTRRQGRTSRWLCSNMMPRNSALMSVSFSFSGISGSKRNSLAIRKRMPWLSNAGITSVNTSTCTRQHIVETAG